MQSWPRYADEIHKELSGGNLKERGFQIVPAQEGLYNPQSSKTRDEVFDILSSLQNRVRGLLGKRVPKSLRDSMENALELANKFVSHELSREVMMKSLKTLSDDIDGAIITRKELDAENDQLTRSLTADKERAKLQKAFAKAEKRERRLDLSHRESVKNPYVTNHIIQVDDLKKVPPLSDEEIQELIKNPNLLLVKLGVNNHGFNDNQEQIQRYEQHRIFRFLIKNPIAKKSFPVLVADLKKELKRVNNKIYPTDLKRIIEDYIQKNQGPAHENGVSF